MNKLNQPIDYLQELKRDVSTKGLLTPLQKRGFEKLEETLNQPVKDLKKLYDEISYRLMPNPARDLKMYEFLREVKKLIEIHYQPDITIEDIKQEWEDEGYAFCYHPNDYNIINIYKDNNDNNVNVIYIWKDKTYGFEGFNGALPIKLNSRLTKTFRALDWEV